MAKWIRLNSRGNLIVITVGAIIVICSLFFSTRMAITMRESERQSVELWARAMESGSYSMISRNDPVVAEIINSRQNIPFVLTNSSLEVVLSHLVPQNILSHPDLLRKELERMSGENTPIIIDFVWSQQRHILFFSRSAISRTMLLYPFIQTFVIIAFIAISYMAVSSSKRDEQNRVWIGLAKETAHQLGTPTSSLLGWIEYLKTQDIEQTVVDEMGNDIRHLMKIVDRFSKIGSETILSPANVNEVVGGSVMYFRARLPRNVSLEYNGLAVAPIEANINSALFEWVIENLMKNSLDALQGSGELRVNISHNSRDIFIDVSDTGKGIAKGNWKKIFEPGFTTKTRGWGLGLSLSRRIVEDYHHGKIAVTDSEVGRGTTIRVTIQRA